ncbi:MAG: LytTR family DNA-binding domain-containing protein [Prevotellaceae bacterium]|nr:LytTR family DNA-binding domain-containing protein [Prevotellaceae bacterium]
MKKNTIPMPESASLMRPIPCFIVDDEPLAVSLMRSYVERTPFLRLAGCFSNALDALTALKTSSAELLFLDIQMPQWSGLQLARSLDTDTVKIIFTTAFEGYALDGFQVDALDYLLKPISYADFLKAARKAQRYLGAAPEPPQNDFLMVKANYKWLKIKYNDILYLEAMRDYVAIHLASGAAVRTLSTLRAIAANLPDGLFVRVQRSFIVNVIKIQALEGRHAVFGKTRIPMSDAGKKELMAQLKRDG